MNAVFRNLTFLFFITPLAGFAQSPETITRLDSIFADWTPSTPGGVACVVDHGNIIYRKAFGLADVEGKIPNAPHLKYDLASITKQFTAMCIALLEEQGKLSVEDNLKKYYPGMKIPTQIKIKNLIDHTSGLRDASVLAILSGKMNLKGGVRKKYNTKAYYLECFLKETDLNFPTGSELTYTNFNYVLLGDIVEKVSGKTLSQYADSAIFKPLGMANTIFRDREKMKIPNEAKGYLFTGKKFKPRKGWGGIVGDHNLLSTIDDMVKWELNFFNNKLGKDDPKLIEKICTSSKLNNGELTKYGYGLWVWDNHGVPVVSHGGDDGRHTCVAARLPQQELIVIVLANSSRFNDTQQKTTKVMDLLLENIIKAPIPKKEEFQFITLSEKELQSRAGLYTRIDERGLAQMAKLTYVAPDLYTSPNYYWQGLKLNAITSDHLVAKDNAGDFIGIHFSRDSANRYVSVTYKENPVRLYTLKKEMTVPYADFKGAYTNASTGATLKVKSKKGKLVARKGILRIPLIPFDNDQFYGPENDVLFIFQRDQKGAITKLKANASDFRNFVFVKEN